MPTEYRQCENAAHDVEIVARLRIAPGAKCGEGPPSKGRVRLACIAEQAGWTLRVVADKASLNRRLFHSPMTCTRRMYVSLVKDTIETVSQSKTLRSQLTENSSRHSVAISERSANSNRGTSLLSTCCLTSMN